MQVDVLAVQEVLGTPEGVRGVAALIAELDALTGGEWRSDFQECGDPGAQRVGWLWNAARATLEEPADVWELNGDRSAAPGNACAARLRPGRFARLRGPGGVDASLLSVHLDSGTRALDWKRRRAAMDGLGRAQREGLPLLGLDADAVVLGDFNSMGRAEPPRVSGRDEVARLGEEAGGRFRVASPDRSCTDYYPREQGDHGASSLDHVLVSRDMEEAAAAARVSGFCAVVGCPSSIRGDMPAAFDRLSDHCPVLLDLADRDRDPE